MSTCLFLFKKTPQGTFKSFTQHIQYLIVSIGSQITTRLAMLTCYDPHEQVFARSGLPRTRCHQLLQRVEGVEVDKVGAAEAGNDW